MELAGCMRGAGLPLPALAEYVRLSQQGDVTIPDRRALLLEQKEQLTVQLKSRIQWNGWSIRFPVMTERWRQAGWSGIKGG